MKIIPQPSKKLVFWVVIITALLCLGLFVFWTNLKEHGNENATDGTTNLARALYKNKTQYVENNVKVITLIDQLPLPSGITRGAVELSTAEKPYGVLIHYNVDNHSITTEENDFFKNSVLLFATIDNVDKITHAGHWKISELSSYSFYYTFSRSDIENAMGFDVREYSGSEEKLAELMAKIPLRERTTNSPGSYDQESIGKLFSL